MLALDEEDDATQCHVDCGGEEGGGDEEKAGLDDVVCEGPLIFG
jgi:hypothetical protein